MVRIVQGPGYQEMTTHPNDMPVCAFRGTPKWAIYAYVIRRYGGIGAIYTHYPLDQLSISFVKPIKKHFGTNRALIPYENPVLPVQEILLWS